MIDTYKYFYETIAIDATADPDLSDIRARFNALHIFNDDEEQSSKIA